MRKLSVFSAAVTSGRKPGCWEDARKPRRTLKCLKRWFSSRGLLLRGSLQVTATGQSNLSAGLDLLCRSLALSLARWFGF